MQNNIDVINSFVGYGNPENSNYFIFTIEEQSGDCNDSIGNEYWKIKFKEVYCKTYIDSNSSYYSLSKKDFEDLYRDRKDISEYDKKKIRGSIMYSRIKNIIGEEEFEKIFYGVTYPIAKPSTSTNRFCEVDIELFGLKDFNEWKEKYFEKRMEILKKFLKNVKYKMNTTIYTFGNIEIWRNIFKSILNSEPEKKDHIIQNKRHRFYYYHNSTLYGKTIEVFNCYPLSFGHLSNKQLKEIM